MKQALALLCLLSATAVPDPSFGTPIAISWHQSVNGTVRHPIHGDFTGDLHRDVVHVVESGGICRAVLTVALGVLQSQVEIVLPSGGSICDVARVASSGSGNPDTMITVGSAGLGSLTIDPDSAQPFQESLISADPLWINAQRVFTADLDGDGTAGIVGLDASGLLVLIMVNGTGGSTSFTTAPLDSPALDQITCNFHPQDGDEIVVTTSTGTWVYNEFAQLVQFFPLSVLDARLHCFRDGTLPEDRVALLVDMPLQFLTVIDHTNTERFVYLGPLGSAYGAATGDVDNDGVDDLILLRSGSATASLMFNQPGDPTFSENVAGGLSEDVTLATATGTGPLPPPLLADFDNDRDKDLVFYNYEEDEVDPEINLLPGLANDAMEDAPSFLSTPGTLDRKSYDPVTPVSEWELKFEVSPSLPSPPSMATDLELTLRHQDVTGIADAEVLHTEYLPPLTGPAVCLAFGDAGQLFWGDTCLVAMRYVQRQNGNLIDAWPVRQGSILMVPTSVLPGTPVITMTDYAAPAIEGRGDTGITDPPAPPPIVDDDLGGGP